MRSANKAFCVDVLLIVSVIVKTTHRGNLDPKQNHCNLHRVLKTLFKPK